MSQVIAISNQKGGVSKTTTAANLGIGLSREGKNILLIDLDPQANLTMAFGFQQPDSLPHTVTDVLERVIQGQRINYTEGLIRHTEGIDLMPSSISLAGMETRLINEFESEPKRRLWRMKRGGRPVSNKQCDWQGAVRRLRTAGRTCCASM